MASCTTSTDTAEQQLAALEQLLGAELGGIVGQPGPAARPLTVADLLTVAELYHEGRAMGCDPIPSLKLAAAELFVALETEAAT